MCSRTKSYKDHRQTMFSREAKSFAKISRWLQTLLKITEPFQTWIWASSPMSVKACSRQLIATRMYLSNQIIGAGSPHSEAINSQNRNRIFFLDTIRQTFGSETIYRSLEWRHLRIWLFNNRKIWVTKCLIGLMRVHLAQIWDTK